MSNRGLPTSSKTRTSAVIFYNGRPQATGHGQKIRSKPGLPFGLASPLSLLQAESSVLSLRLLPLCLLPVVFGLLISCGKVGDPLPPIPRAPVSIRELAVLQRGNQLILSFPIVRTSRSEPIQRIDLYRLIEPLNAPLGLPEEDFSLRASVIATIPAEQIPAASATITYQDVLDLKSLPGQLRYRYAARIINRAGQSGSFSNYALITPLVELAAPPTGLNYRLSQTELEVSWSPPEANENGRRPANVAGYNLYRRTADEVVRLNSQPVREARFVDRSFQFGTSYEYFVRSLSLPIPGAPITEAIESNDSITLSITPQDTFPPSAPSSITIASVAGIVSLFWPANPEPDVAGYNIYRSEDPAAPPEQWIKLNAQLHTPTTFRDGRVQIGKQYFYQLTAVDSSGNESPRSETKSEIVNP